MLKWIMAILVLGLMVYSCAVVFGQETTPEPSPTPGTPDEWLEYVQEQPDHEWWWDADWNPVTTPGGQHIRHRYRIDQSESAGVAIQREAIYTEKLVDGVRRGLNSQGFSEPEITEVGEAPLRAVGSPAVVDAHSVIVKPGQEKDGKVVVDVLKVDGKEEKPGAGWIKVRPGERVSTAVVLDELQEKPKKPKAYLWTPAFAIINRETWIKYEFEK